MKKNVQLHIPEPCHEDWAAMRPGEKGRFCSSCCKTVVDFSLMSDREVLEYLASASGKVCGRFTPDQLQRDLMTAPERKRKGWMVWNILMMGLLFAAKTRGQGKTPKPVSHQIHPGKGTKAPIMMGAPVPLMVGEVATSEPPEDTVRHYQDLPPAVVPNFGWTKGMTILRDENVVVGGATLGIKIDTGVQRMVTDTLAFLGIGKKEVSVYPNPAGRGTTIRLSIDLRVSGNGRIGLYNEAGIPIQIKAMQLNGESMVELFNLPASIPGGLYFLRLSAAGLKKEYVQKLIVL